MAVEIKSNTDAVRWPAGVRLPVMLTFEHQSGEGAPLFAGVQSVLNFTRHAGAKAAKPEQFIDTSLLSGLEKSIVTHLYGR